MHYWSAGIFAVIHLGGSLPPDGVVTAQIAVVTIVGALLCGSAVKLGGDALKRIFYGAKNG